MIKGIGFDLFGTIIYEEEPRFTRLCQLLGKEPNDYEFLKLYEGIMMRQRLSGFREPLERLFQLAKLPFDKINQAEELLSSYEPQKYKMYEDARNALRLLKGRYRLGLLTNVSSPTYAAVITRFKLEEYFDVIVCSFDIGHIKPEKQSFLALIRALGLNRDTVLFVGDSFKDDMRGAESAGITAVLIDRNNARPEVDNRIDNLSQLGRFLR